jgi:SAM-dependent methyltransferase
MSRTGPEFYDVETVFEHYSNHRDRADNPNETIEQPILWEMIGDPSGFFVLDLGCGDARIAEAFKTAGAARYVGIEGSVRMVKRSHERIDPSFAEVRHLNLENFQPSPAEFDLIVSSLAFHYVEDIRSLFVKLHQALKPDGKLVFSVEHPVITSCNSSLDTSPIRGAWTVDGYFERGPRQVRWMGDVVTKYHRTLQDFFELLGQTGFQLEKFRESDPAPERFRDVDLWRRRRRIPLFLLMSATKHGVRS